jgi:hypothetical protein
MIQKTIALLAGVLLAGLVGSSALGQTTNTPAPPAAVPSAPTKSSTPRDRTEMLTQRLGLSDEQKLKVKPILDADTQKAKELRQDTNLTADEQLAKYAALREETNGKLKTVLTPEQYDKYLRPVAGPGSGAPRKAPKTVKPAK